MNKSFCYNAKEKKTKFKKQHLIYQATENNY